MGNACRQPQKLEKDVKQLHMRQRQEYVLLQKGRKKKKKGEIQSGGHEDYPMIFRHQDVTLTQSLGQVNFPVKTSGAEFPVWIDSRENADSPEARQNKENHKNVMPQERSEIVKRLWRDGHCCGKQYLGYVDCKEEDRRIRNRISNRRRSLQDQQGLCQRQHQGRLYEGGNL